VTRLTPEQFGIVVRELALMLDAGEGDEFWRVMTMFAQGRFNRQLTEFPAHLQRAFAAAGRRRRKDYTVLLAELPQDAGFNLVTIGNLECDGKSFPLVKLVSLPPASPFATQIPICLTAGIHGDEPDGVLAAHEFARRFARSPALTQSYALTIYPCLNPVGYERLTRENGSGKDLNREFGRASAEPEVRLIEAELRTQTWTGFINAHSDYESFGLYAYAAGPIISERLAKPALFQASGIIPINTDPVIDGHPAELGIINQKFDGSLGPLSKSDPEPFDITLETPNLFALHKRVEAQATAIETILHEYRAVASEGMYL